MMNLRFVIQYFFSIVLLCGLVYGAELSLTHFEKFRLYNLFENIVFISVLHLVNDFVLLRKFKFHLTTILWFFIALMLLVEGLYFIAFQSEFSSSALFIALDSNYSEVIEFIYDRSSFGLLFYMFIVCISTFISWIYVKPRLYKFPLTFNILLVSLGVLFLFHPLIRIQNFPYVFFSGLAEYASQSKLLNSSKENLLGSFSEVKHPKDSLPEVIVILIGESTSRNHMGVYGYKRNTSPKLSLIKDELILFDDVISGYTYTVGSLTSALSIRNNNKYIGNILQLLNNSDYKTFWLSNQPPIGIFETLVSKIAVTAKEYQFITSETWLYHSPYDEELFPFFNKILEDQAPKKVIFVHLIGTHGSYSHRYPKENRFFPTTLNSEKKNTINHYDNAVLYNDFVVSHFIHRLKKSQIKSSLLYFSDHGEEVYDNIDFVGHTPDKILTPHMVEIPFILWQSEEFKSQRKLDFKSNRKYILNDLSISIADLCQVTANEIDLRKSIFSPTFVESPRIILDSIDFDQKFKKSKTFKLTE